MTGLDKAIFIAGTQGELAKMLGVTRQLISIWVSKKRGKPPINRAIEIEKCLNKKVSRQELRPDIFGEPSAAQLRRSNGLITGKTTKKGDHHVKAPKTPRKEECSRNRAFLPVPVRCVDQNPLLNWGVHFRSYPNGNGVATDRTLSKHGTEQQYCARCSAKLTG